MARLLRPFPPAGAVPASARPVAGAAPRRDLSRDLRRSLALTLLLYALLASALAGALPAWALVAAVPLLYARLSLGLHELLHAAPAHGVPAFHRLTMIFDTPLAAGFREHRAVHLLHHRFGADARDPERFQIEGPAPRALLCALLAPERSLALWVRRHGVDAPLARDLLVRAVAFVALAAWNPAVFAVYWLTLRASIGVAGFVFHHLLHARGAALGTYALPAGPVLRRAGRALLGDEAMRILVGHRAHHLWPELPAWALPELPADFVLPAGPVDATTRERARRLAAAGPAGVGA